MFHEADKLISFLVEKFRLKLERGRERGRAHPLKSGFRANIIEEFHYRTPQNVFLVVGKSSLSGIPQIGLKFGEGNYIIHALPLCRRRSPQLNKENIITYLFYSQLLPYEFEGKCMVHYSINNVLQTAKIYITLFEKLKDTNARDFLPSSGKVGATLVEHELVLVRKGKIVVTPELWRDFYGKVAFHLAWGEL